jgi:hypothetical protein
MRALQGEISQVVVDKVVVDGFSGTESIVAFVTPFADSALSKSSKTDQVLRKEMVDRLQDTVPLWMIPNNVISISAMPKTATGKLDRRSLKNCVPESVDLKSSRAAGAESDTITRSSTNKVKQSKAAKSNFTFLMSIWCRILRIDTETIDGGSSWSEAGGDSLTAMMFVREARKAGYQLSSDKLMSDMSLIELCNMFRRRDDTVSQSIATPDDRTPGCDSHVPLTDFQHFYLSRSQHLGKDQLYKYDITFRGEFDLIVSRAVYLKPDPHRKVTATMSTLVQAAWSIVLSTMSGGDDVMFLCLVHGRDENVANSDQIIGCCVAECPLGIQLEKTMSIADLTELIQKQAMSSTSHAHLGSNTISTRCTDWPSKERIYHHSSFVLHQTVIAKDHIVVGDTGYIDVGEPEVEHKLTYDFDLATSSTGLGDLSLTLRCLSHVYTMQEAEATADAFSMILRMLVAGNGNVGDLKQQLTTLPSLPRMEANPAQ